MITKEMQEHILTLGTKDQKKINKWILRHQGIEVATVATVTRISALANGIKDKEYFKLCKSL